MSNKQEKPQLLYWEHTNQGSFFSYLLRVTIDSKLTWNGHIQRIVNKANQINAFLHRNLHHCPSHVKCNCYKSMVRPIVEYASPIWDPYTSININKIEAIQKRAAEFCFNDYSR